MKKTFFFILTIFSFSCFADENLVKKVREEAKIFSLKYGKEVMVLWGEQKITPKAVLGLKVSVDGENIEKMAENFLISHADLFLQKNIEFKYLKTEKTKSVSVVRFQQTYKGIRVKGRYLTVKFDSFSRIRAIHSDFDPLGGISIEPKISTESAIKIAFEKCGSKSIENETKEVSLIIVPKGGKGNLAYRIYVPTIPLIENIYCYVDARTGEVILKENLIIH